MEVDPSKGACLDSTYTKGDTNTRLDSIDFLAPVARATKADGHVMGRKSIHNFFHVENDRRASKAQPLNFQTMCACTQVRNSSMVTHIATCRRSQEISGNKGKG